VIGSSSSVAEAEATESGVGSTGDGCSSSLLAAEDLAGVSKARSGGAIAACAAALAIDFCIREGDWAVASSAESTAPFREEAARSGESGCCWGGESMIGKGMAPPEGDDMGEIGGRSTAARSSGETGLREIDMLRTGALSRSCGTPSLPASQGMVPDGGRPDTNEALVEVCEICETARGRSSRSTARSNDM
jgi:hypothetical protein